MPFRLAPALALSTIFFLLLSAAPAAAHQTAVKYATVDVTGADVAVELRFQPADVTRPLGLPDDATPSVDDALAAADRITPFVARWIAVRNGDAPCAPTPATLTRAGADARFLALRFTARCDREVDRLTLDLAGFFAVDRKHEMLLDLTAPDAAPYTTAIGVDDSPVVLTLSEDRPSTALAWIYQGMLHIYGGIDHICFVLALLLVVVIQRGPDGSWQLRPFLRALRSTAVVITAFTIAHSLTLIAASLGYIRLPSRFVEAMIALSIAYTAVEDVLKPDVRWRYVLTFGFGLMHGLGFASVLAVLLPPDQVVVPLLEFNVGVELGQLSIVAVALPVFWTVARTVSADTYRRELLIDLAAPIAALGLLWFIERAARVTLLGL